MPVYMHVFPYILNYVWGEQEKAFAETMPIKANRLFCPKKKPKKISAVQGLQARRTTDWLVEDESTNSYQKNSTTQCSVGVAVSAACGVSREWLKAKKTGL